MWSDAADVIHRTLEILVVRTFLRTGSVKPEIVHRKHIPEV